MIPLQVVQVGRSLKLIRSDGFVLVTHVNLVATAMSLIHPSNTENTSTSFPLLVVVVGSRLELRSAHVDNLLIHVTSLPSPIAALSTTNSNDLPWVIVLDERGSLTIFALRDSAFVQYRIISLIESTLLQPQSQLVSTLFPSNRLLMALTYKHGLTSLCIDLTETAEEETQHRTLNHFLPIHSLAIAQMDQQDTACVWFADSEALYAWHINGEYNNHDSTHHTTSSSSSTTSVFRLPLPPSQLIPSSSRRVTALDVSNTSTNTTIAVICDAQLIVWPSLTSSAICYGRVSSDRTLSLSTHIPKTILLWDSLGTCQSFPLDDQQSQQDENRMNVSKDQSSISRTVPPFEFATVMSLPESALASFRSNWSRDWSFLLTCQIPLVETLARVNSFQRGLALLTLREQQLPQHILNQLGPRRFVSEALGELRQVERSLRCLLLINADKGVWLDNVQPLANELQQQQQLQHRQTLSQSLSQILGMSSAPLPPAMPTISNLLESQLGTTLSAIILQQGISGTCVVCMKALSALSHPRSLEWFALTCLVTRFTSSIPVESEEREWEETILSQIHLDDLGLMEIAELISIAMTGGQQLPAEATTSVVDGHSRHVHLMPSLVSAMHHFSPQLPLVVLASLLSVNLYQTALALWTMFPHSLRMKMDTTRALLLSLAGGDVDFLKCLARRNHRPQHDESLACWAALGTLCIQTQSLLPLEGMFLDDRHQVDTLVKLLVDSGEGLVLALELLVSLQRYKDALTLLKHCLQQSPTGQPVPLNGAKAANLAQQLKEQLPENQTHNILSEFQAFYPQFS